MKPKTLEDLLRRARTGPETGLAEAPPFFSQRVTARWLSAQQASEGALWEAFALRGVAFAAAAMIFTVALSASLWSGNNDESDLDYTVEVFSLP
jgi:hypothetical protein